MTLCAECERVGAAHPTRDPVLVGDVLADSPVLLALWRGHELRTA
ncbi:hypothetical protein [Streptomyces sp. NPDC004266]